MKDYSFEETRRVWSGKGFIGFKDQKRNKQLAIIAKWRDATRSKKTS